MAPEAAVAITEMPTVPRARPLSALLGHYAAILALALTPLAVLADHPYWINILAYTYLFAGLAAAWNIIGGFGGQFSLGHGVFFGIGAYTVARLYLHGGISPWIGLIPAAALGTVVAVLISWPTFRLRGPFFAIATMAVNEVFFVLANYFESLTGGPRGLLIPFKDGFANMIFVERWKYALLMFAFMAAVVLVSVILRRSRLGHYLLAVREDEDAARASGIDVLRVKLSGMALSAALTSVGGGLFVMYVRVIDPPTLFTLPEVGVKFALVTLIGGIGSIVGPIVGAFAVIPIENYLRGALGGWSPGAHLIVFGLVLVLASLFLKKGVVGGAMILARVRRK